jgi:hypothetical protein
MSTMPSFALEWLGQWTRAAQELQRIHDAELRVLSEDDARRASEAVLGLVDPASIPMDPRWTTSGLIEQQRLFLRARAR